MDLMKLRQGQTFFCIVPGIGQVQELFVLEKPRLERGHPFIRCRLKTILFKGKPAPYPKEQDFGWVIFYKHCDRYEVASSHNEAVRRATRGIR